MNWHDLLPVAVFFVYFIASVLSGMAGGGGGFIVTPFLIFIGLTPQQSVATGKFASFGLTAGAIAAFKGKMLEHKKLTAVVAAIAVAAGIVASLLVQKINNSSLQLVMGILILALVPVMLRKDRGVHRRKASQFHQIIGGLLLALVLLLQGILSGGIGSLVSVIFIIFFGLTSLEANALKRKASLILNTAVVVSLLTSGLINFKYGLSGMLGGLLGGYAGSKTALKKGDEFAKYALIIFMVISGVWLILSA